jgi:hypothetical protein
MVFRYSIEKRYGVAQAFLFPCLPYATSPVSGDDG